MTSLHESTSVESSPVDVTANPGSTLESSGLKPHAVASYAEQLENAHAALDADGIPREGRRAWVSPGRIEILGKHVDYAGGRSLLCAVDRGIVVVARAHDERTLNVRDATRREALSVSFNAPQGRSKALPWAVYPETVVRRLVRNFGDSVRGCDVAISSNLPPAAGVSSSSALTVGLTLAMAGTSGLAQNPVWQEAIPDRIALAGYVGALENGLDFGILDGEAGVGTLGGAQDQTAILNCHASQLDVFSWAPVRHERTVPFPADYQFVIGVSGVIAAKSGGAKERYNRAARTAHRLVDSWNRTGREQVRTLAQAFAAAWGLEQIQSGDVPAALVKAAENAADSEFTAAHLIGRLHQFHDETYRFVPAAAQAFADVDIAAFGRIAADSQRGAERALENQIAETVGLVRLAHEHGAVAASAFGAGFGGSVWALVEQSLVRDFSRAWKESYAKAFPTAGGRAQVFATSPSPSAFEVINE